MIVNGTVAIGNILASLGAGLVLVGDKCLLLLYVHNTRGMDLRSQVEIVESSDHMPTRERR